MRVIFAGLFEYFHTSDWDGNDYIGTNDEMEYVREEAHDRLAKTNDDAKMVALCLPIST